MVAFQPVGMFAYHLELGILRGDFLGRASNQIQPDSTLPVIVDGKIPGLLHIFPYDAQRLNSAAAEGGRLQ
jgi:hypothetical protein